MNNKYHFIGIGGIGMSALAALLLDRGFQVSGSDLRANQVTKRLKEQGADIFNGHDAKNIKGADYVIFSSAISKDNPELLEAKTKQVPILKRAKLLAELMEGHIGITVAGAHGKTTTSSMIANLMMKADFHPTTAVGGIISGGRTHAKLGKGKFFVTEVDESDGSFLYFSPHYSIITNIDLEHIDYYPDWQSVLNAYKDFIENTAEGGIIFPYGDDERLLSIIKESQKRYKTYGFLPHNHVYAADVTFDHFESRFNCIVDGEDLGQVLLRVPGRHNVANALACITVGLNLSISFDVICESLKDYKGVQRRFQLKDTIDDVWIIDDYAHHPTEIQATIETAQLFKESLPDKGRRLITVFQPHRYSRLAGLIEEFAKSLVLSDQLIITDVYAASETPISGVTAEHLCDRIQASTDKPVRYLPKNEISNYLLENVKPLDIVLTLGAGDITRTAEEFIEAFKSQSSIIERS